MEIIIDWKDLIGEKIEIKFSPYQLGSSTCIVKAIDDYGYVSFDEESSGYHKSILKLLYVYKSEKYPMGW